MYTQHIRWFSDGTDFLFDMHLLQVLIELLTYACVPTMCARPCASYFVLVYLICAHSW